MSKTDETTYLGKQIGGVTDQSRDRKGAVANVCPHCAYLPFAQQTRLRWSKWLLALPIAFMLTVFADPALGHTVLLSRATVEVEPNRIITTLQVCAEDFIHYGYFPAASQINSDQLRDAVSTHGRRLTENFIIRKGDGVRIPGRLVRSRFDEPNEPELDTRALRTLFVEYTLESVLEAPPRYLTFQQTLGAAGPSVRAQLLLQVRSADRGPDRFITLTSGGNVETLAFSAGKRKHQRTSDLVHSGGARSAQSEETSDADRFKSVRALVSIHDDHVTLDVFIPVTLVESWMTIPRGDRDFLDPSEMNAARVGLTALLIDQAQLTIDGRRASSDAVQLEFLAPDQTGLQDKKPSRRLGAWTARVGGSTRYSVDSPPQSVELVWRLFNNAVLNARATVVFKDDRQKHRLTTYQPALTWRRPRPAS